MTWRHLKILAFCLTVLSAPAAWARRHETGFLDRAVTVGGVEYRYEVYVPRDFDPARAWPVVIALHGGGDYGSNPLSVSQGGLALAIRRHPEQFPAIVIFAQAHADGTPGWQGQGGAAALAAADSAMKEFHGDPRRLYLTGFSAGGNGAWYLAYHHPERFAAAVVICGFVTEFRGKTSGLLYPPIAPVSAGDPYAVVAKGVASIPIWIVHGDADKNVSVEESRHMVAALKAIGANVHYTELPGVEHPAWDPAYQSAEIMAWMMAQRRR